MHRRIAPPALLICACLLLQACQGARTEESPTLTPSPTAPVHATPLATPPPSATSPAAPTGALPWPTTFDVEFRTATYWSAPPFRIPFTVRVGEPGWFSGHLHAEFVDLLRFDGIAVHQFPSRMVGFGDPGHVRGVDGDVDVATLDPDAALDLLAARASLATSNRATVHLLGLEGARVDIHSATQNNALFGGADGEFGLGPALDVRLTLLARAGRLLAVVVLAPPGGLDAAWGQALPLVETVALGA